MGFTPRMTCTLQCVSNNWLSSQYPHISHYVAHISPQWPLCVCECVQNEPTVWSQPLPWFFEKPFSFFGIMFSSGFLCAIFFFFLSVSVSVQPIKSSVSVSVLWVGGASYTGSAWWPNHKCQTTCLSLELVWVDRKLLNVLFTIKLFTEQT